MGSELNVIWEIPDKGDVTADEINDQLEHLLEKWDTILSDYDDQSEASLLTQKRNIGRVQTVSVELAEVIIKSKKWLEISRGAFDVTCGAVTTLRRKRRAVAPEEWNAAIQTIGWDGIEWDEEKREIKIKREGLKFDFGGIGKGIAVDKTYKLLVELGVKQFIINFAGNLRAGDPPSTVEGWPVEIDLLETIQTDFPRSYRTWMANLSMATSGDQFQNFPDWKSKSPQDRTSHILDPQDGAGVRGRQAVTIFAQEASDADAAATAACVQLRRKNPEWLDELSGRQNGMFGLAQEIDDGESTVIEFGGFSEKLKVIRS